MLHSIPEVTEHLTKGKTPRAACQGHVRRGYPLSKLEVVCALTDAQALALDKFTRLVRPGQSTGRVRCTHERVRSWKWALPTSSHPGASFTQGQS